MSTLNPRSRFPILSRKINGQPLVYLDNASTTQKPRQVIDTMTDFYAHLNANIHRGIHTLSVEATTAYETTRDLVQKFIGAKYREEIIFTGGTTESLNTLAFGLCAQLSRGDEILLSEAEHHSNIVPWQIAVKGRGIKIKYIPLSAPSPREGPPARLAEDSAKRAGEAGRAGERSSAAGRINLQAFKKLLTRKTKIIAITHASNVTGAITPLEKIIPMAHKMGTLVVVDAAQSVSHLPINVQKLDCDFLVFSGHKMYGPTGVGVLYGKKKLLEKIEPRRYGGHMIEQVTKEKTTFASLPEKFEGGTMPIAEVIGLGAAMKFIQNLGWKTIIKCDRVLCKYGLKQLSSIPDLKLFGPSSAKDRLPIFAFTLADVPAHDIATLLDQAGIAVRSGHHCAQILHQTFKIPATTRASFAVYNTKEEIDKLVGRLKKINKIFISNPPS